MTRGGFWEGASWGSGLVLVAREGEGWKGIEILERKLDSRKNPSGLSGVVWNGMDQTSDPCDFLMLFLCFLLSFPFFYALSLPIYPSCCLQLHCVSFTCHGDQRRLLSLVLKQKDESEATNKLAVLAFV